MARYWFAYRPDLGKAIDDPAGYRQTSRAAIGGASCFTGADICAVYAVGTTGQIGSLPAGVSFTTNLQTYINDSLTTNTPLPVTLKYYLYQKD